MNHKPLDLHFFVAVILVLSQSLLGFWRFPPSTSFGYAIGIAASAAIVFGIVRRYWWARITAILVAIFGVLGEVPKIAISPTLATANIVFYFIVICWLSLKDTKVHFTRTPTPKTDA